MEKKTRLGRGLDALFSENEEAAAPGKLAQVPVAEIQENPYQPRKTFDDDELAALRESIRTHGVLQPLVVRQVGERFQLIAGERRLRAARAAGMDAVPVTVVDFNDQQILEAALVENIQRSDLNPIEKAHGFKEYLTRYHMTHDQLAGRLGLGRPTITNLVALLDLPPELQDAVRVGQLSTGHAKVLKGIADPARQVAVGKEVIARGLSVHATEAYVKQMLTDAKTEEPSNGDGRGREAPQKTAHVQGIEDELRQKFGTKVEIRVKGKDKGQFVLTFENNDDFERVLGVLRR
jgi:ParB family transcriptional regulator, chromosome partitioning protein